MRRLAVVSHKGGAGKTSSAVMLAEEFARRGFRVALVDADRQRGAGILLGIDQPSGSVEQTRHPRLRYLCSTSLPLREIPTRAEELSGMFDVAVVDTPSLDDPLAKAWLQVSSDVLFVLPVEPVSIRTLEGADMAMEGIRRLNPGIEILGTLPTMFDEGDPTQRELMLELMSQRPDGLLSPPIPNDPGLTHRAQQKVENRTTASEATLLAYQATADFLVGALKLDSSLHAAPAAAAAGSRGAEAPGKPSAKPQAPAAAYSRRQAPVAADPAPAAQAAPPQHRGTPLLQWAVLLVAALALLLFSVGFLLRSARAQSGAAVYPPATRSPSRAPRPGRTPLSQAVRF